MAGENPGYKFTYYKSNKAKPPSEVSLYIPGISCPV